MDNFVNLNLRDAETEEEFNLRLSPNSAFKAQTGKFLYYNKLVKY